MTELQTINLDFKEINRNLVTKSNDIIEARYRLSTNEQKIILMMSYAGNWQKKFKTKHFQHQL